jgi:hypothetical protein
MPTNYGNHYYQVDLMTNDFFEKYNAESVRIIDIIWDSGSFYDSQTAFKI